MSYLTIANIPPKWVQEILILKNPKTCLTVQNTHLFFVHFQTNVSFSSKSPTGNTALALSEIFQICQKILAILESANVRTATAPLQTF